MKKNMIEADKVSYRYPGSEISVIDDISLDIHEGSFVALLGHNGSGKSTLAKAFNAILLPTGGKVYVAGIDTDNEESLFLIRQCVGMVFQNPDNQIVATVVEEDVAFAPENLGVPADEIRERVDQALKAVGMYKYRLHAPHLLSGGQKQRMAIAGVIAMRPKCIIFDEPTAMLDPVGRNEVMKTIKKLNGEMGITIVLITHHMSEALQAERVVVLNKGKIFLDGTPKEIFVQVDLLKSVGLAVPQTVEIMFELNKHGFNLPLESMDEESCAVAIAAALKEN